jgi:hypothetical protein
MANGWIYDKPGGWGSEEWGINNRTLGVDCHCKLEGVGCFMS